MRVLVSGANGFVGRRLVEMLAARGFSVTAAVRSAGLDPIRGADSTAVVPEITDTEHWAEVSAGHDAAVHLAAHVHAMSGARGAGSDLYNRVNVVGSDAFFSGCQKSGVAHLVFLSSIKVNGERTEKRSFRATDVPQPEDAYAVSKLKAEQALIQSCSDTSYCWTIIHPPLVYGPGVKANFAKLIKLVSSGIPVPFGKCQNRRSLVFVDNLCDLIACSLGNERSYDKVLLVSDDHDLSVAELLRMLARLGNSPDRVFSFPIPLLVFFASVLGKRAQIERLTQSLEVNIDATRDSLGWTPPIDIEKALQSSIHG